MLLREIGRGAMGVVYEAVERPGGRRAAVKVLSGGARLDPEARERFRREFAAVRALDHPGIVRVLAGGDDGDLLWYAMELAGPRSLADLVRDGPTPPREAARLVREVARALAHAHERGLVHRDVKPSNVLLAGDGRPRLADFGLVRAAGGSTITGSSELIGTPAYMAPEQARGERVGPAADVYALGALLYALLAGRAPYPGDTPGVVLARLLVEGPPPLDEVRPGLPERLVAIVRRAMARDPRGRHPTARALAEDLDRFLAGWSTAKGPGSAPWTRPGSRWVVRAGLVAFAACLAFVGLLVLPGAPGPRGSMGAPFVPLGTLELGPASPDGVPPSLAWAGSRLLVSWVGPRRRLRLAEVVPGPGGGAPASRPVALRPDPGPVRAVDLAAVPGAAWIAWQRLAAGADPPVVLGALEVDGYLREVLAAGSAGAEGPALALGEPSVGGLLAWQEPSPCGFDLVVQRFGGAGRPLAEPEHLATCGAEPAIAWNGEAFGIAWHDLVDDHVRLAAFVPAEGRWLGPVVASESAPCDRPRIAPLPGGFALAWHHVRWRKDWIFVRGFRGPALVPIDGEALGGAQAAVRADLAGGEDGRLDLACENPLRGPLGEIRLRSIDPSGRRGPCVEVSASPQVPSVLPAVAPGPGLVAVAWNERGGGGFYSVRVALLRPTSSSRSGRSPTSE